MNARVLAGLLFLIAIGLGIAWFVSFQKFEKAREHHVAEIVTLSNELNQAAVKREELEAVNRELETNLSEGHRTLSSYSNNIVKLREDLATVKSEAKAAAEAAEAEVAKRDAKITELEGQRDDLTKRMTALNQNIASLEDQIAETENKLEASEGDRDFLLAELRRLQAEKAELERQFNDLAVLREQVRRLRDELSIAKRLEWLRRGFYGSTLKGAERLQQGFGSEEAVEGRDFDLDVELQQRSENGGEPSVEAGEGNSAPQ